MHHKVQIEGLNKCRVSRYQGCICVPPTGSLQTFQLKDGSQLLFSRAEELQFTQVSSVPTCLCCWMLYRNMMKYVIWFVKSDHLLQELALARAASYVTSFPQPLKDDGPGLTLGFWIWLKDGTVWKSLKGNESKWIEWRTILCFWSHHKTDNWQL